MAELITHPPIEPAAGQRVVLIALEDSAASDVCLRFALNESGVKAGDFVQILNVTSGHQTQQSSLAESPYEIFGGDGGRVPLVSDKQHPNPANEPSADFLYKRYEPALKAAGLTYRINVIRFSNSAVDVGKVIVANADYIKAKLIIMSTANKTGLVEFVAGSTSNYVCHNAKCSVLIVRDC